MEIIIGNSANEIFIQIAKKLLDEGKKVSPRNLETLEINNLYFKLLNPNESTVTLPARKLDFDYLTAELDWYLSGDLTIKEISKHSSFWKTIADSDGIINSNYGHFVFAQKTPENISQYQWCLNCLKKDNNSRQAVINYNQLKHKYQTKDFPCTIFQSFRIVNRKLNSFVVMRSNDLIYGLSYDLPWFTYIQKRLAKDLGIDLGVYEQMGLSVHCYKKHFDMLKDIARSSL